MSYRENGQTAGRMDMLQDDRIKCSGEHLIKVLRARLRCQCLKSLGLAFVTQLNPVGEEL